MGKCDGHHHTSTCSYKCILLCLLFHIHLHSCHGADLDSTAPPHLLEANNNIPPLKENHTDVDNVADVQEQKGIGVVDQATNAHEEHINFLQKVFEKYGNGKEITYEGFEHLLENLGLGKLHIHDHKLKVHFVNGSFEDQHPNHNHSHSDQNRTESSHTNHDHIESSHTDHDHIESSHTDHDHIESSHTEDHNHISSQIGNNTNTHANNSDTNSGIRTSNGDSKDDGNIRHSRARSSKRKRRWVQNVASPLQRGRADRSKREAPGQQCYSPADILSNYDIAVDEPLSPEKFLQICPVLIYQLDNRLCSKTPHIHDGDEDDDFYHSHDDADHHHNDHEPQGNSSTAGKPFWNTSPSVWGYAFLSVTVISLVGLVSVAVIPLTTKVFYNHLLQFLVALAVGSLMGDACLHLLPHALSPHEHPTSIDLDVSATTTAGPDSPHQHGDHGGEGNSRDAVWKGLVALSGIYFFFLMERVMGLITARTRKNNKQKRDILPHSSQIYKPIKDKEREIGAKLSAHTTKVMSCEEILMVVHPSKDLKNLAEDAHDEVHENCDLETMDQGQVQGYQQGHGHAHHHHGPLPSSVSSVAWMVIMGDGLHNFSDGLAIGAAFANSLTGGLSTSLAVFCHELPHELGDFAVLLRAGMRPKQAIVYNLVSSVLCLFGMIVGVAVGNLSQASLWIFAMIGGSFIYIALVDMLPEMIAANPKAGENPLHHLILQNVGLIAGAAIMLVIALYEDQIKIPHWEP